MNFKEEGDFMWPKTYRDYKTDQPLIQNQVSPGHGIIGCEMHDLNGWGTTLHEEIQVVKKENTYNLNIKML